MNLQCLTNDLIWMVRARTDPRVTLPGSISIFADIYDDTFEGGWGSDSESEEEESKCLFYIHNSYSAAVHYRTRYLRT